MLALDGETFADHPPVAVSPLAMKFAVLPGDVQKSKTNIATDETRIEHG
jgi:hypothetical protein